jgi:hypothetical protein
LDIFGRAPLSKGAIPWANLSGLQTRAQTEVGCLRDQPVLFVTFEKGPKTTIRVVKDVYRPELFHPFGGLNRLGILNVGWHDEHPAALRRYVIYAYALFVRAL